LIPVKAMSSDVKKIKGSASTFDLYAEEYDQWYFEKKNKPLFTSELRAAQKLGLEGFGAEVGVGTGAFASELKIPLGVDPARNMLKIAKKRKIAVLQAVAEFLPFKDNSLDYLVYILTLCFLNDPENSLAEARRTLKKDGFLVLCFVPRESSWGKFYTEKKRAGHRIYKHASFYSKKEVFSMLGKLKFRIVDFYGTLYQRPYGEPICEEPKKKLEGCGFLCVKAVKLNEQFPPPSPTT